ncbi:peroxiredoxin [Methylobacterium sp. Leaf399]|uniref:OsmC family protein n=1 Tax=unclassified Methylobacterium TaxID=2615210 RepID=UPI0006FFD8D7|nr:MULTISPECIES: OsmC family protein [unclassified Methylobacterium]KQP59131.1 peroxiredoxin [Methylobacterium sp. Leaf108]KQT18724.1 peroxiredoxin [Methylobacterium sp. Leaf399]
MADGPRIRIKQIDGYRFMVDFGEAHPGLLVDEAEPFGGGHGPFPEQIMVAGVTNCLCASLMFASGKFGQDLNGIEAEAECRMERNAEGRLRIAGIAVTIRLGATAEAVPRIGKVLEQFERFCTVSESVKAGIPVSVAVDDAAGQRLK